MEVNLRVAWMDNHTEIFEDIRDFELAEGHLRFTSTARVDVHLPVCNIRIWSLASA